MQSIAENRFTITKGLFMEGMLRISREDYAKAAGKAASVVLGLWVLFFLYTLLAGGDLGLCLMSLLIIGAALFWLCVGMPRSNARRRWKTLEGKYGTALQRTTVFYPDRLEVRGDGLEKHIAYEQIRQILTSSRLLILVCRDKTGVLVALDGFTHGTKEEITAAIRSFKDKE